MTMMEDKINKMIQRPDIDANLISDGYHTFKELYDHRIALFIALCKFVDRAWSAPYGAWKSKIHSDGTSWDGWFIAGIGIGGDMVDYHLPIDMWDKLDVKELDKAPEYDGHTPADVLKRLLEL